MWGSATLQTVQQAQGVLEALSVALVLRPDMLQSMDHHQTLR